MDNPSLKPECTTHLSDHEVLMSFVNDRDRVMFEDWWFSEGLKLFKEHAERNFE